MANKLWTADYIKKFHCIGSQCEDTCCKGWVISVDKNCYDFYKNEKDTALSPYFQECISTTPDSNTDDSYGAIELTSQGTCPFLTEDNLCKIYLEYGSKGMCKVCTFYPRITKKVNKEYYQTGDLSCPEMARLILLSPKLSKWIVSNNSDDIDFLISNQLNSNYNQIKSIQQILINIINMKEYSLSKRLWLISAFIEQLHVLVQKGNHKAIKIAKNKVEDIKNGKIKNYLEQRLILLIEGILNMINVPSIEPRFKECLNLFQEGLCIQPGKEYKINEILTHYHFIYKKYYQPFTVANGYILENYCMHDFMNNLFPYTIQSLGMQYEKFILCYSILQFMLIGISASSKGINKEIVIQLFQTFSRTFEHSETFFNDFILSINKKLIKNSIPYNTRITIFLSE
ncbi:flagellin lysine-N-methylase [Bacillus thuringiensis]|uniref:flagellin lysine-N-methylase n=1 Tax=Bacillus thuringiensis TaxID=1428 RepID=UPI0022250E7D|nr:flagellin lysine-N-methylase [Bacillus thuringiensis]UYX52213.1 flagellin lysine-N-methylase [Bacillus thuringiensis]